MTLPAQTVLVAVEDELRAPRLLLPVPVMLIVRPVPYVPAADNSSWPPVAVTETFVPAAPSWLSLEIWRMPLLIVVPPE